LSGFLGLVQDHTYSKYGRPKPSSTTKTTNSLGTKEQDDAPAWQESMFYLHFLALPMFIFVRSDLAAQFAAINSGPQITIAMPISFEVPGASNSTFNVPSAYFPLLVNTVTQLVCVAGVHRLTTHVSALSVTLVLVVRKAVSLVLSALGFGLVKRGHTGEVNQSMMWSGAFMVLVGTILYSTGGGKKAKKD
jgi:UDP-xylose/UDP-N-acetylglucosamine transporter B4